MQCHRLKHEWNTMSFETKWSAMKHNVICPNTMSSVEAQRSTMSFVETQCHLLDLNVIRWKWHLLEHHVISEARCNTITMSIVESEWNNMRHDETHIICWSTMSCVEPQCHLLKHSATWNIMSFVETQCPWLKHNETHWNIMPFVETRWNNEAR